MHTSFSERAMTNRNNYKITTAKKALHDSILIEVIPQKNELKSSSGILIPEFILDKHTPQSCAAYVVDIGATVKDKAKENNIDVGDIVYFRKYAGVQVPERKDPLDVKSQKDYRAIYFDDLSVKEENPEILRETHEV